MKKHHQSPCPYPNLVIYPNTSIIYKVNSNLKISCIGDHLPSNFVICLYQIKNDKYYIRASTTSNVLRTELNLTEQDDGTCLQCYIIWKYHSKTTKTIDLLLDRACDAYPTEDERIDEEEDERMFVSSQLTSTNEGKTYIRASTTSNVLRTELYLTEQDDASSLQCYIIW